MAGRPASMLRSARLGMAQAWARTDWVGEGLRLRMRPRQPHRPPGPAPRRRTLNLKCHTNRPLARTVSAAPLARSLASHHTCRPTAAASHLECVTPHNLAAAAPAHHGAACPHVRLPHCCACLRGHTWRRPPLRHQRKACLLVRATPWPRAISYLRVRSRLLAARAPDNEAAGQAAGRGEDEQKDGADGERGAGRVHAQAGAQVGAAGGQVERVAAAAVGRAARRVHRHPRAVGAAAARLRGQRAHVSVRLPVGQISSYRTSIAHSMRTMRSSFGIAPGKSSGRQGLLDCAPTQVHLLCLGI